MQSDVEPVQSAAMWEIHWESSETLCWLMEKIGDEGRLKGLRAVELGCGGYALPSVVAAAAGAIVTITDGEEEAVRMACNRTNLDGRLLDWRSPTGLARLDSFEFAYGSDLFYEEESCSDLLALLIQAAVPVVLFTSPRRKPFLHFAEMIKKAFAFSVCTHASPPLCEPTMVIIAAMSGGNSLALRLVSLAQKYEFRAEAPDCSSAPPPPPAPPLHL